MSEVVPVNSADESPESNAPEGTDAEPTTPAFDEATWKKRLSGKDQALTAAQRERDALKAEYEALAKWKAEREQAEMSEYEKAQARIAALEAEAQAARAEAQAAKLTSQYPLAAELLGDDLAKFDPVRVAEINGRLAKEQAEAESAEPEPRIDTNSPRRPIARPQKVDLDSAKRALASAGNPYFDDSAWGSTNPNRR